MEPKIVRPRKGPEAIIQEAIVRKLRQLEWLVMITHGSIYQAGFPDLYCAHSKYGARWIDVKDPARRGDIFTPAQHISFPKLYAHGIGVWILTSDNDDQIALLHKPCNFWHFFSSMNQ